MALQCANKIDQTGQGGSKMQDSGVGRLRRKKGKNIREVVFDVAHKVTIKWTSEDTPKFARVCPQV